MNKTNLRRRFGVAYALAGASLLLSATLLSAMLVAGDAAASCFGSGQSVQCGNRVSNNTVGRTVIFPTGRPGERQGKFIIVEEDGRRTIRGQVSRPALSGTPRGARTPGTLTRSLKPNFGKLGFPFTRPQ